MMRIEGKNFPIWILNKVKRMKNKSHWIDKKSKKKLSRESNSSNKCKDCKNNNGSWKTI